MAFKEGQFDIVELMVNDFQYQFECSTCEWNDSVWFSRTYVRLLDTLGYVLNKNCKNMLFSIGIRSEGKQYPENQVYSFGRTVQVTLLCVVLFLVVYCWVFMASKEGEKKSLAHNLLSARASPYFLLLYAMLFWKSGKTFFGYCKPEKQTENDPPFWIKKNPWMH